MSTEERRKIADELGLKLDEITDDHVADYRAVFKRSTQWLQKLVNELDDNEKVGLAFGMLPARYLKHNLVGPEVAKMIGMNPRGQLK